MLEPKSQKIEVPEGTREATSSEKEDARANLESEPRQVMEPEKVVLKQENIAIVVPSERVRGQSIDIALIMPPSPPIKSQFFSDAQIRPSIRKFYHSLRLNQLKFTPSTDEKKQPIAYLQWALKVLTLYNGIYVGLNNDYIESDVDRDWEKTS